MPDFCTPINTRYSLAVNVGLSREYRPTALLNCVRLVRGIYPVLAYPSVPFGFAPVAACVHVPLNVRLNVPGCFKFTACAEDDPPTKGYSASIFDQMPSDFSFVTRLLMALVIVASVMAAAVRNVWASLSMLVVVALAITEYSLLEYVTPSPIALRR